MKEREIKKVCRNLSSGTRVNMLSFFLLEVVVKTECDVVSVKVNTNGIA